MDLFSGAGVGAVMGELLKAAMEAFNKGREFKPTLESNIETLNSLEPLVDEMMRYNVQLDQPRGEIERLQSQIHEGKELARKCSKLSRWKFLTFPRNQERLQAKDENLGRYLSFNVQAQNARNLMEVLFRVREIVEILSSKENFGQYHQIKGLRGAPEEPKCLGMDERLSKLKVELLKDDVPVLVLTGLGGSGKSTLAKKICWDPQVKGKFGTNIFFVIFSETPNVKNIVKTLFDNCGCKVPEFQNDEDAINRLGLLMRVVGRNPILLVLDDVWENSETLVEKFRFQIPGYKILVTSRVAFRRFGIPCRLEPLGHDEALSLFLHFAQLNRRGSSYRPDESLVNEIVKGCKGSPLALEVIGGALSQQPFEMWESMKDGLQSQSILESSHTDLLRRLQQSLDMLENKYSVNEKECFMDLGLFPEDQRIPVTTLIDMWAELHNLDDNGRKAMTIILDLTTRNLIKLIVTRKVAKDTDMYYNNHFIMLHDLLRKLAIHQSKQEPFEERKKLSIELYGDKRPDWWVGQNQNQNQQGILSRMLSLWSGKQKEIIRVAAQILSISTDEDFASDWCDMLPDEAEVLILNTRSSHYSLPPFTEKMSKLKVLIVTNYGFHRSELNNFDLLGSLSNLKRIRLEKVSVPCLCILQNLQKLSLHMCNAKDAFEDSSIQISDAMPNLVEMSIDYCKDLVKLPDDMCSITPLKKLSITNCHKLSALPQGIGNLKNLEVLRLSSCSALEEMPETESVAGLDKLQCLDISDCVSLAKLPEDIGKLQSLKKLYMKGCSRLSELPFSVKDFENLEHELYVICDEERAALWESAPTSTPKLKIEITKVEPSLNWLN